MKMTLIEIMLICLIAIGLMAVVAHGDPIGGGGAIYGPPALAPSYVSIFASNVTVTINTINTDTLATSGWTLNETNGPSYNTTTGIFTIQPGGAGIYVAGFSVSVSGQSNAAVHYHLFKNGAGDPAVESHRKLSGGDVGNAGMVNLSTFAVSDTIKVMTQQDTGTTNQTIEHGSFYIQRISR